MPAITGFPPDNNLWLVKWIDKIRLAHLSTKSASVSVLLQKLNILDPKLLPSLKGKQLQEILNPQSEQNYQSVRVLVGVLPEIDIGAVFQSSRRVAQLPSTNVDLKIPLAELSCESRGVLDLEDCPHNEWPPEMPYRVLNKFEYHIDKKECYGSSCLIFKTSTTDYIIPRSVIFKTFYAQNVKFARAFTNGDWPSQCETLICMKELESGLKTEIDSATGDWNIVLQLKVPPELAPLIGIFIFDEYGKKCASSIYSSMFKARHNNGGNAWFIDARIPFQTSPEKPLKMSVQGFALKRYTFAKDDTPSKFLVTKIVGSSLPELPQINRAYVVNGQQGVERVKVDEPAPFANQAATKPANAHTTIDNNSDSNETFGTTEIFTSSFTWINPPVVKQMQKSSSKSYNKPIKSADIDDKNSNQVSAGNNTYSNTAKPEANIKTLIRNPDKRFENLMTVLRDLKNQNKIFGHSIVGPLEKTQSIEIGGIPCWNFLDEESRLTGEWPKKGWRMKKHAEKMPDGGIKFGQPRAALVAKIEYTENDYGYWIEIEQKSASYRSPYLTNVTCDAYELIQHSVEVIARTEAKNLVNDLTAGAEEFETTSPPFIKAYKHGYVKNTAGDLSQTSVLNFLKRCHDGS